MQWRPDRRTFLKTGVAGALLGPRMHASAADAGPRPVVVSSGNGLAAAAKAMELMEQGSDTLDAVIAGVNIVENDPNDMSVGYGGLPNEDGVVELASCVMHGPTHRGGAVAALFGKEVFGGTGSHIFAPSLVGKGILVFSYKTITGLGFTSVVSRPDAHLWLALGLVCLFGTLLMAWARPANLRILSAALLASVCVAVPLQHFGVLPFESVIEMFLANSYLFSICVVACDPAISPRDDEAKWLYGLMIGALAVLMACYSLYAEAAMSAILVANLFVPTLDLLSQPRANQEAQA